MKEEANNLKGTPVVSFSDFTDKDDTKNKYGQRVPKKLKKDDPRVKFHKDTMGEAATSDNTGYGKGYHGNVDGGDKQYSSMHTKVKRLVGAAGHLSDVEKPNKMVKHFLDSTHGRHIADQPSDSNITSRFKKFKNTYNPEMNEEAEQMDEISKKTLGSYVKKAASQLATSLMTAATTKDIANAEFHGKRYAKRNRGIEKAVDKLAKEETQQDPSHYNIVHRDSKRVVGTATTMKKARSARDRHDNKYGSYAHSIVPVFKEEYEQMDEGNQENKAKKNAYVSSIIQKKLHPSVLPSLKYGRRELKKEEAEQMDEISQATRMSYLDAVRKKHLRHDDDEWGDRATKPPMGKSRLKMFNKQSNKALKVALKKEEVEQMDELKKSTLAAYIGAASRDRGFAGISVGAAERKSKEEKEMLARMGKRQKGVTTAASKLAREEVEQMDEGRMSEIAMDIDDHIKPHIAKYKKIGGAEHLAGKLRQVGEKLAKMHGMPSDWMHKQVSHAAEEHLGDQMNEKHLTPAQRKKVAESSSGGQFGPKRYGSREDDWGHDGPEPNSDKKFPYGDKSSWAHVHVNGEKVKEFHGPTSYDDASEHAHELAYQHKKAGQKHKIEIRDHSQPNTMIRVNESKNIIREVIRKAVDKQGTNKANGKTATGSPVPKITINPTALDNLGNKRGIGGT